MLTNKHFGKEDWSSLYSARDGRGVIELPQNIELETIRLRYEYAYRGEAHIDYEVNDVLQVVRGKAMRKAYTTINLADNPAPQVEDTKANNNEVEQTKIAVTATKYEHTVQHFLDALKKKDEATIRTLCTSDGFDLYTRLLQYGNCKLLPNGPALTYKQVGKEMVVRYIPMSFSFSQGMRKSFVENVVLTLNNAGKIDNICFGLGEQTTNDIMNKTVWSEDARLQIIGFLENYQTAFALKRLDYINTIFADDATIIIGKVVRKVETSGDGQRVINKYTQRTQLTKKQYLKNLENCFKSNEFVNIRFAQTDVVKAGKGRGEIYGIQLKQDYYSTHYGDTGYLYLQVDISNPKEPVIRVRTWQDQPDPELGRVYGMEDF